MAGIRNKILCSLLGACAGLAGLVTGGGGCSGSCHSCLGCAAAGGGVIAAVLFGSYQRKKEETDGLD